MWSKLGPGTCSAAAERSQRSSAASKTKGDAAPRLPPVLSPASTACPEVFTASGGPFPDILLSAYAYVRVCSKVLAAQRTLHNNGAVAGPPPSRHAETLLKSPPAGFHSAGWTGPVAVQRATQRPTAVPSRMVEAALGLEHYE